MKECGFFKGKTVSTSVWLSTVHLETVEIHLACSAAAALSGPFDIDYIRGHISLTGKCSLNIFSVSDLMTLFTTEPDSNLGCQSVTFHTK